MRSQRLRQLACVCLVLTGLLSAACDPLAPEPTSVAIALTSTPRPTITPTPSNTPTATPSPTPTPVLPTETPVPSATPWRCQDKIGSLVDLDFESEALGSEVTYRAYLPPCYDESGRRFPYVILMHGLAQDQTLWTDDLGVQRAMESGLALRGLPPMILIMPTGGSEDLPAGLVWEDVVIEELIAQVEATFCTWENREGRAVGGISRGGFWAYSMGLRHPDLFSAVGGHSAAFYDDQPPGFNPLTLARGIDFPAGQQPRFWLDVGGLDPIRGNNETLVARLADAGVDVSFTVNPEGRHNAAYWAAHISEYLTFYGAAWPRDILDQPSCQ
jgi:enterochelin esterase-like enzyme